MGIKNRLEGHFLACGAVAAAGAVGGVAQQASAAIVYSGVVNIPIPGNIDGVYLNIVTGAQGTSGSGTPGWDINPYFGANTFFAAAPSYGTVASGTPGNVAVLTAGTLIDGTNATSTNSGGGDYPTTSPGGLYGFKFQNEALGNQIEYGWARVIRGATTSTAGTIVEYAYDNTGAGINAGAVPTPGSLALLAVGAAGLVGRRRR